MMTYRSVLRATLVSCLALAACSKDADKPYAVEEVSLAQVSADLAAKKTSSVSVTKAYIDRINTYNAPLNAVIVVAPDALEQAKASDQRRKEGKSLGPMDGVPILLKDNIDATGMANTAGSFALAENFPVKDAEVTRRLRAAGVVILGKTNLSQWAGFRTTDSYAGSSVGGTPHNPYDLTKSAAGSSSGSGIAVATSFAAGALGTDTSGSITGPSNVEGIVGLRPTRGLVSRSGVVPITELQDTTGPLARSVTDVAMMLGAMAGSDPADARTKDADTRKVDYTKVLDKDALKGKRIGVLRGGGRDADQTKPVFDAALEVLKAQGAELVDLPITLENLNEKGLAAEGNNFKHDIAAYLASAPPAVKARTLDDLLAFNKSDPREAKMSNIYWEEAAAWSGDLQDPKYRELMEDIQRKAGPEGYDAIFNDNKLDAFVTPSGGPAGVIPEDGKPRSGGRGDGPGSFTRNAAIGGYPILNVPMGNIEGMPVDMAFVGPQWSEPTLLGFGYAYEQAGYKRMPPEAYKKAVAPAKP